MTGQAMISHELRMSAMKTVMMGLRACGPWTVAAIKRELKTQCIGVTADNVDAVWSAIFPKMTHKRTPMIAVYEMFSPVPKDEVSWVVADRMYDSHGHYKGAE